MDDINSNPLSDLFAELKNYLDLRIDQAKLSAAENLARILSKLMYFFAMMFMCCLALGFLSVCLSRWLNNLTDSTVIGPVITFGILLLIILFLYLRRNRLMLNQNLKIFIRMFFERQKNSDDHSSDI